MQNISNRTLISQLYASADQKLDDANYDTENWREWYQVVQDLTLAEKIVYVVVKLNQTVTNGGFAEFYEASFGIFAPEIVHVLNEAKATQTANIVSNSIQIVNKSGLLDDAYKNFIFNTLLSEHQLSQLYNCDVQYDQLQGVEDLESLLGDYLKGEG